MNVTRRPEAGGERSFLFYMGSEEETHTKVPETDTDDFMALEVVEGGKARFTADMGAGLGEVLSEQPIVYGQWNYIEIERYAYTVKEECKMQILLHHCVVHFAKRHGRLSCQKTFLISS